MQSSKLGGSVVVGIVVVVVVVVVVVGGGCVVTKTICAVGFQVITAAQKPYKPCTICNSMQ